MSQAHLACITRTKSQTMKAPNSNTQFKLNFPLLSKKQRLGKKSDSKKPNYNEWIAIGLPTQRTARGLHPKNKTLEQSLKIVHTTHGQRQRHSAQPAIYSKRGATAIGDVRANTNSPAALPPPSHGPFPCFTKHSKHNKAWTISVRPQSTTIHARLDTPAYPMYVVRRIPFQTLHVYNILVQKWKESSILKKSSGC